MMFLQVLTFLPFLSDAAIIRNRPHVLEARQFGSPFGMLGGSKTNLKPPATTKKLIAKDPSAVRVANTYGPLTLNPKDGPHSAGGGLKLDSNSDTFMMRVKPVCTDCMVHSAQAIMVFANGTKADIGSGVYGHHIMVIDMGRKTINPPASTTCNGKTISFGGNPGAGLPGGRPGGFPGGGFPLGGTQGLPSSPFIGKGGDNSETTFAVVNSTVKSGFYIGKDDMMVVSAEIVNYDPVPKELYLNLDFEYTPGHPQGYLDVGLGGISVEGCGRRFSIEQPPTDKSITYTSPKWDVIQDGYLLDIRPHLHDGGLYVKVFNNGKLVCDSEAVYGGGEGGTTIDGQTWETITSYTPCLGPVPIKKGDVLTMISEYDLTKHRLRPNSMNHEMGEGVMAIANFVFAKAE